MEIAWIATILLGFVFIYLIYALSSKKLNYWKEKGVPFVNNSLPILGSMTNLILGRKSIIELNLDWYREFSNEKYFGFYMFHTPFIVIRDPELINQVLIKDFTYFQDRNYEYNEKTDIFSAGLFNIAGDKWRILRHKLTPTFTSGKMKLMFQQIKECNDEMVLYLKEKKDQDVDTRNLLFKVMINVTGNIAFGLKVDALNEKEEKNNTFLQTSRNFFKPSLLLQIKILIYISAPKIRKFLKLKLIDDSVNDFFQKLTGDLLRYREKSEIKRNDFLQLMLDQKEKELKYLSTAESINDDQLIQNPNNGLQNAEEQEDLELIEHLKNVKYDKNCAVFTDYMIAAQIFVFISAGTEMTSTVLSFVLYELAVNKDVQKRLQEEIDSVLSNQELTYDALKKMTYMEQILNEVLRLRPPGGILVRICTQDYKMPGTSLVINKGTFVQIPALGLHKDPKYFPDPETFDPDRFQNMDAIPKGVFFPFGDGPRICIAMRLAMLEMKVCLAAICSSFNVVLSEKTQTPLKLNKKSALQEVVGGIWVKFEPREIHYTMEIFSYTMEISWLITAVLAILVIYCIYRLKDMHINYWKKRGVPVISSANPITGFMTGLLFSRKSFSEMLNEMYKSLEGEKFGGYFQFFTPTLMVRDTELINQILIKDFTHFEDRGPPQEKHLDLFGLNLSNLCGDEWRAARHKLTPTFTSGKLKMMFEPIKNCSEEGVLFLRNKTGQDIEARGLMGKFIIKIIARVAFGLNIDTFNEKEATQNKFIKATTNFFKPSLSLSLKFLISTSLPKFRKVFRFKLVDDEINNFFKNLTKDIINHREESGTRRNDFLQLMVDEKKREQGLLINENNTISCNEYEKEDIELLDQLKNIPTSCSSLSGSYKIFTEEFITSQTFLFISGGSETTAGSLSFVLYELAVNQDVQKRIKEEVADILSSHEFNYQAIKKMAYLEQTIYETFRLHAVAGVLVRYCTKDYKIPGTDVIIEKGSSVMVPVASLQRDPQYFPDPEKFNPDRFEDMDAIPKGAFFPFGSGPRICIAMRLAMLEMKIILATLLLNYTITLSKKTKLPLKIMKNSFLNHVDGGIWIKFEEDK
ncbi:uncharacterized protein LOC142320078 [Lycorma delicatula]|uniref:uncharacterized protein LOC142320078 n=1 Tax=Lycorma delicatula TaxID=130591 RepID=UPI003F519137